VSASEVAAVGDGAGSLPDGEAEVRGADGLRVEEAPVAPPGGDTLVAMPGGVALVATGGVALVPTGGVALVRVAEEVVGRARVADVA